MLVPQDKEVRLFIARELVWKPIFFYCMILVEKLAPFFGEIKRKKIHLKGKSDVAKSVHEESSLKT